MTLTVTCILFKKKTFLTCRRGIHDSQTHLVSHKSNSVRMHLSKLLPIIVLIIHLLDPEEEESILFSTTQF